MPKVFPPRYFIGLIEFEDGKRIEGTDCQMVPMDKHGGLLIFSYPKFPFEGLLTVKTIQSPVVLIQYSINCLDGTQFLVETLKHDFVHKDTFFRVQYGLPYLMCLKRDLYKTVPSDYVFKDISRNAYPVTQFIS